VVAEYGLVYRLHRLMREPVCLASASAIDSHEDGPIAITLFHGGTREGLRLRVSSCANRSCSS
jgi:hypothetical protein